MSADAMPQPLQAGDKIIDFELSDAHGRLYSTAELRKKGLLLLFIFKVGCGTCKYSAPFIQRLHRQYAEGSDGKFTVLGVSQDDAAATEAFAKEYGNLTFPIVLDSNLDVAEWYNLIGVPDLYLLGSQETILYAIPGHFNQTGFNEIAKRAAEVTNKPYTPVVLPEDDAPSIKPG
ncbi:peroxiredoxin family protein [Chthonomonas calidirosea]|uniref:peroxiredoxin family protein n=1 Tax=Chthonomonas calidirosea TaxID=454171 RepID=UPI0006EC892D|nr:TlpA disulfide reductase family protein [Chthonomonas calidirosea]CEK14338.1 Peroxiredoxin [Chthonomonas calidirosea]